MVGATVCGEGGTVYVFATNVVGGDLILLERIVPCSVVVGVTVSSPLRWCRLSELFLFV